MGLPLTERVMLDTLLDAYPPDPPDRVNPVRWPVKYALDYTRTHREIVPDEAVSRVHTYYMDRNDPDSAPHRAGKGGGMWSRGVTSLIINEWAELLGPTQTKIDLQEQLALAHCFEWKLKFPEFGEEKYEEIRAALERSGYSDD